MDTFDYKPQLSKDSGNKGKYRGSLLGSPWEFNQYGEGGLWISELLPNIASMADQLPGKVNPYFMVETPTLCKKV